MRPQQIQNWLEQLRLRKTAGFRILLYLVLAAGLIAMMAITAPKIREQWSPWIEVTLWSCLGFFAVELLIKSWNGRRAEHSHRYLYSGRWVLDTITVLPIPIALLAGVPPDTAWLLAILWIFKLTTVFTGLSLLGRIIKLEARPLASVFILFLVVLMSAGIALHLLERTVQPERFGSLPLSLWWAVTTLTTTGYGDAVPETLLGRLIAGAVMISGLGVFGLWTGILATGFATEHRRREFIRNWDLVTSVPFLRNLDAPAIIELTHLLRHLDLPGHSVVVRRGRAGDCMYFIAAGEVEVQVEPKPVRLGPGTFFGEFALLDGGPRRATVTTTIPSTFLVLDVTDFRTFTAHHPELARQVELESKRRKAVGGGEPDLGAL